MKSVARHREPRLPPTLSVPRLLVALTVATGVRGLSNVSIDVPIAVASGSTVNMTCKYDLQSETLYAVKWYKGPEFFRFLPKELPPIAVFGALGTKVDVNRSDAHRVVLKDVQPNHSGKYRCEVSAESPSFITVMVSGYMHVVNLPDGDPEVHIEKPRYAVGDTVRGNCSVPVGSPPANLTWTVNGVPVNSSFLINATASKLGDNQRMTIAGLDFEIIPDSFSNGKLFIICRATVFHLYQKKADAVLIEERPRLASVLGTRESSYIPNAARRLEEWFCIRTLAMMLLLSLR
ncbi:uncharacterized protein [Prorops nasuta]|uniref:uncharacterized protein n=1 Tax=Prorops nasuta TaxID=863751 RepID=UPI0034CDD410